MAGLEFRSETTLLPLRGETCRPARNSEAGDGAAAETEPFPSD